MTVYEVLHWLIETNRFAEPAEKQLIHDAVDRLEGKEPAAGITAGTDEPSTEGDEVYPAASSGGSAGA